MKFLYYENLEPYGIIRYYSGFFTRHYFRKLLFSWTTYNYFDAIDSVQKYVPIKDE